MAIYLVGVVPPCRPPVSLSKGEFSTTTLFAKPVIRSFPGRTPTGCEKLLDPPGRPQQRFLHEQLVSDRAVGLPLAADGRQEAFQFTTI